MGRPANAVDVRRSWSRIGCADALSYGPCFRTGCLWVCMSACGRAGMRACGPVGKGFSDCHCVAASKADQAPLLHMLFNPAGAVSPHTVGRAATYPMPWASGLSWRRQRNAYSRAIHVLARGRWLVPTVYLTIALRRVGEARTVYDLSIAIRDIYRSGQLSSDRVWL